MYSCVLYCYEFLDFYDYLSKIYYIYSIKMQYNIVAVFYTSVNYNDKFIILIMFKSLSVS